MQTDKAHYNIRSNKYDLFNADDKITSLPDTLCDVAYTCTNSIAIATPTWRFRKCLYCNIFGVASHFTFYSVVTNWLATYV